MKTFLVIFFLGLLSHQALATDLLKTPPPCPAPADLPASTSADYDPAREAASGMVPADIEGAGQGLNMDVPLYRYPREASSRDMAQTSSTAGSSSSRLPESGIPIGGVAIRNGKAVSANILGRETLPGAPPVNPATGMPLTTEEIAKAQKTAAAQPCGTR